jgi:hypothetical protein
MSEPEHSLGVDQFSTVSDNQLIRVERIRDSEYVLAHTEDMGLIFGGLVSEEGMESCQIMIGEKAARFDPDTMEMEYVTA